MKRAAEESSAGAAKPRGRPFAKGQSGNPHGRRRGVPNKVTSEARAACNALVDDVVYRAKLLSDLRARTIAPAVECMLWHYGKGKPVERVEVAGPDGGPIRHEMSDEELIDSLSRTLAKLGLPE